MNWKINKTNIKHLSEKINTIPVIKKEEKKMVRATVPGTRGDAAAATRCCVGDTKHKSSQGRLLLGQSARLWVQPDHHHPILLHRKVPICAIFTRVYYRNGFTVQLMISKKGKFTQFLPIIIKSS